MIPDKIELSPQEVALVIEWAGNYNSFNPSKDELALFERLEVFARAHAQPST